MDGATRASSAVRSQEGLRARLANWLLLEGDRRVVAAAIVVAFTGTVWALVSVGVLTVGASSSVPGLFGSGITAGVVTLVTIALSINQLILSRVFGSPGELIDRLEGARDLRGRVEELAGRPSSPNDPAAFLSLVAATLQERAAAATALADAAHPDRPAPIARTLETVAEYGKNIDSRVDAETPVVDVLGVIVGPAYAMNMAAVGHLREEHAGALGADLRAELRAVEELLESVAVVRQFFKTMALQQDFATLSRLLVYSGLGALLVSVSVTLAYRSSSVTLAASTLSVLVPLGLGVVVTPFAVFAAYILRAATVAYRTVSVGPFVPPRNR